MSILLMGVFALIFLTLYGRIVYIQATGEIEGVELDEWADEKRTNTLSLDAERGRILDRTGMVLAYNQPTYRLYAIIDKNYSSHSAEPLHVTDPESTARQLAPLLNMEEKDVLSIFQKGLENGRFQVEFGNSGSQLTAEKKEEIEALGLPGIYFIRETRRFYPNGPLASHLIGFTQNQQEQEEGVMGIEKTYNEQLVGKDGFITYKHDKYAFKLLNPEEIVQKPENGADIYLTIDQKIQTFLEDAMTQVEEEYEPEQMMAIVMDPKTGKILAMANRPTFDPNERKNIVNWYNDVISHPIEPGSTMKIFTLAAAIDAGVYNGEDTYQSGSYKISENAQTIHDHRREGWGVITYNEGVQRSSNVGFAKLVWEKLGTEEFLEYLHAFHFDQKTGIDIDGERTGTLLYRYPIEKVTTAFGQGTTVTAIQLMKAATAIANDGKMMKPYVVEEIVDPEHGEILKQNKPVVAGEPIRAETARAVKDLLETVITSEHGTGRPYRLEDYTVAGKTGTAQIPDPESGGYMTGKENYIFSFLGMAPKEDPELMMYVAVKQPNLSPQEYGPEPVSYIFKTVMENSLHYLNVNPDKENTGTVSDAFVMPDYTGKTVQELKDVLESQNIKTAVIGNGDTIQKVIPEKGTDLYSGSFAFILTDGEPVMPDLTGWSLRQVLMFGELFQLKIEHMGNGYVVKQNIPGGNKIQNNQYLIIQLEPPGADETESGENIDKEGQDEEAEASVQAQ
ncbi:penicillin-binding protein [Melghiribacillus thermohalophilus]|nr:penicillin-binding protein [Melghiribacillus thermohalophilus]